MSTSQFHGLPKLNPVDITLPDNYVKGAVVVDERISEWNPKVKFDPANKFTYITINKECEDVSDLIVRLTEQLKLPHGELYGLMIEDPKTFLTSESVQRVRHGFMITLTAAPSIYAARIRQSLINRSVKQRECETVLSSLNALAHDPSLVAALLEIDVPSLLYLTLNDDVSQQSPTVLSLILQSVGTMMELSIEEVNWENVPELTIRSVCSFVTGRAKIGDMSTVLYALHWIEQILNGNSDSLRQVVFEEVPFQTLICHLDRSDERVSLATLSLMNTIHRKGDEKIKRDVLEELSSVAFRNSISMSVLRDGRSKDGQLLMQLVPIQRLLLDRTREVIGQQPTKEDINKIMTLDFTHPLPRTEVEAQLQASKFGGLLTNTMLAPSGADAIATMCTENSMRDEEVRWQMVPLCDQTLEIVCDMLGILDHNDEWLGRLIEFLFSVDQPTYILFAQIAQLFHKTWREMQAVQGEIHKVSNVVREQTRRAFERRPPTVEKLQIELESLSYYKIKDIWKQEENERETAELGSEIVSDLRAKLRPSIEQLVRANRKNFMKQGYTFKKAGKGKSIKEQYFFWRLDANEKVMCIIDCECDPFIEGVSHGGNARKVIVKDIADVTWGDDDKNNRKSSSFSRGIRVCLTDGEVISACAHNDRDMITWVDGLCDLINKSDLSRDASRCVERLLNVELRLRLVDVPNPQPAIAPPPLPDDFSWIPVADS